MDHVKMGVIGLGRFGALHARVLSQLPQVELVGVCSRSGSRAAEVAGTCGNPRCYTDPAEMLRDADIQAVDIVTEVDRHTEIAALAMQNGKHVFCEILVAPGLEEMDRLIEQSETTRTLFMPGFLERFDVRRAAIKEKTDRGGLGQLVSIYGRRNIWRGILDEPRFKPYPLILQPGVHTIDQLLWLAGDRVCEVYARTRCMVDPDRPDAWWATLTFENGTIGVIEQSWFVPNKKLYWSDVHLEVVGTDGTAHIREPNDASWTWTAESVENADLYLAPEVHGRISGALEAELAHFADCVSSGTQNTLCSLQDARDALTVGLAIVESGEQGRPVVLPAP
jgi:UDP-N-acetylglucosamine 3-dehydrogenase